MSDNFLDGLPQGVNVHSLLGVEVVEVTVDKVVMQVDVGPKVHQPYGILHGGVSALLAESAASFGGALNVSSDQIVVGTELNCSHLRSMTSGILTATATPVRKGRRVQVWAIDLTDQDGRQICVARCTLQVLDAPSAI
jgi:1,4-dihydroxy-2-naphthoyl-CoA hydrolase